jgi:hypothetical protein
MQADQPQLATDPNLAAEQAQAKNDQVLALQGQAGSDTASLMARFGTRLALGSASAAAAPAAPPMAIR